MMPKWISLLYFIYLIQRMHSVIKFGDVGIIKELEETQGFPAPQDFFKNYALPSYPVVLRGACKTWPAYENWKSDDYLRQKSKGQNHLMALDLKKGLPIYRKEYIDFEQFVDIYNTSPRRIVDRTPSFIREDVHVPGSLQCDDIIKGKFLMGHKLWFGGNYSASAVHKDAADNINCLVYGVKEYILVHPEENHRVWLDRPNGLYSTMDVDDVDLTRFPGLPNATFHRATLHGGDCMFVPYKWIHQVRSYGRNLAVNTWWNYWQNAAVDLRRCQNSSADSPSLGVPFYTGWGDFESRFEGIREHVEDLLTMANKEIGFGKWASFFVSPALSIVDAMTDMPRYARENVRKSFNLLDSDLDGRVSKGEFLAHEMSVVAEIVETVKIVLKANRSRANRNEEIRKMEMSHNQKEP